MAVLPVKLKLKDGLKSVSTYAFLDPGSNVSFCTNTLLEELGGTGHRMEIRLETMGQPCTVNTLAVQGLQVCDLEMTNVVDLPCVYTKEKMPISTEHIRTDEDIAPWLHLRDVVLPKLDEQVGLLIGNNVPDAYSPLQVRTGPKGSPHATQSRLGWIVWNVLRPQKGQTRRMSVNRAEVTAIEKEEGLRELDRLVHHSMNLEFPERAVDDKSKPSQEDKRFLIQAESSVEVVNGHYTLNLPIRNPQMFLPNNLNQALQRLDHLKRKMKRNDQFQEDYKKVMAKLLQDGHAELVTAEDKDGPHGRTWYLPHHGVYHPNKPGKLRVVYDCSANYQGQALNKVLIQGPDLTNRLLGILLRFRQERVAVMGDVESMFHQVGVHETDRNLLRFLWWPDGNIDVEPEIYRMTVHTFGIISSPSIANFALRRTAEDHTDKFEQTVGEGIKKNFYVDDYLTSVPTKGEAIKLIQDTSCLLKQGGFRLTKWTSNNAEVVKSVPEVDRSNEMKLFDVNQEMPSERALGVYWKTENDILGFTTLKKSVPFTRRGILSLCSSVYDPLGITAPFTLIPKGILQDLCRLGIGWDDKLDDRYRERWRNWIDELDILPELEVPRCYKTEEIGQVVSCQLPNFSDASEVGYGVVSYLRLEDSNGDVHCSFVLGKSRVTPLKKITVPRLELAAATTMVRISAMLERELDYDIDEVFFWTDSTSVLKYIQNETCRFPTYVANRFSVIKEASSVKQWKYVPTTENPADYASRGLTMKALLQTPQWLQGPNYIWKSEKDWPEQTTLSGNLCEDPEVKGTVCNVKVSCNADVMERLLNKFSDWLTLKRVTAWILIARTNLRQLAAERKRINADLTKRGLSGKEFACQMELQMTHYRKVKQSDGCVKKLTVDYLQRAEVELIKYVQSQHYPNEKSMLSCGKMISKSSNVIKLDPFMVEGVLRVGGRLANSTLPFEAKYPVLLPKESPISKLILLDAHQSVGHMGKNAILASVRQRYWIAGAKNVIKKILSRCVICQRYQAQPLTQKMANLPMERVNDQPPFSQVGIDYFGPFQIKHGRSTVKRYGVIFTCLVVRAIHLEVSSDLTTDSCIQAIRRFIARRGPVKYIRSDNGSNLVGAERELREAIQNLDHDRIQDFLLNRQIEWEFNTPTASNFGGVWERLIRLVRKVMYSVLHSQNLRLDDESLRTLSCEVEAILNSRPISEMPDSPNDLGALTPNHILLFRCGEEIPPVVNIPAKGVNYCQRRWKQIQYLTNIFWTKWTRQYLPLLQERQKWCVERENLKRDDLVLILDSSPRNSWAMGRVVTVLKDRHGLARSVELKTQAGTVFRPVNKLCRVMEANLE